MESINSFESFREKVFNLVKKNYQNQETYIVCDIYARFSIYIINADDQFISDLKKNLEGLVERVMSIEQGDSIYHDLNHEDFLKPIQIEDNLFYVDRHTQLSNWDLIDRFESNSHIVCYYSFKGGLGRTTALALTSILLARKGKKVLIMDFDLEAPGLASVFSDQESEISKMKGVVDYLTDLVSLKYDRDKLQITDYYYAINRSDIIGNQGGELLVVPAGITESSENLYFSKLSKINPVFSNKQQVFPVDILLKHFEDEIQPDYIFIDARTGLNELGGLFIARYAQTAFLFFFGNQQNMFGLEMLIPKLKSRSNLDFHLVNSPVPKPPLAEEQRKFYLEKSYDLFSDLYYDEDNVPFIDDATSPHFPIEVPYNDLAVLLNNTEKLKSLINSQNGDNPYAIMAELLLTNSDSQSILPNTSGNLSEEEFLKAFIDIVPSSASAEYEFGTIESLKNNFYPRKDYKFIFDKTKYLILGEKGAGKTALYAVLSQPEYTKSLAVFCDANIQEIENTDWIKGLDDASGYPGQSVFDEIKGFDQVGYRIFWKRLVLNYLKGNTIGDGDWKIFIQENNQISELDLDSEVENLNQSYKNDNRFVMIIYDYLDVLISDKVRGPIISALLEVWRSFYSRFSRIRAKIFMRQDIFDREVDITDKVKFNNHSSVINWEYDQLLNVVWKRLWHSTHNIEDWREKYMNPDEKQPDPYLGLIPTLNRDQNFELLKILIGEYMGANNKAYPYNWIIYHVSDTHRRIQPRSLLNLFSVAATKQLEAQDFDKPFHLKPKYMELATRDVAERRVQDIKEEYPELKEVFNRLKDFHQQFPIEEIKLIEALSQIIGESKSEVSTVKQKLMDIGVLYEYKAKTKEQRYHIPDLYLFGMGLRRRGPGAHKALFGKK